MSLTTTGWGFFGHKKINRLAVYTLPSPLMGFYKQHVEYISEEAVRPDMRRYSLEEEGARHYIDIDHYGKHPFDSVPRSWEQAVAKFSSDTLQAYGIVPWHVHRMYHRLVTAYRKKDIPFILATATDLGHYIADAHVPLHTTENYNGQLTGQHGIHGFWESRLPELFANDYSFYVGPATYIENPLGAIWDAVEQSHAAVDSVLLLEAALHNRWPSDQKYSYVQRGQSTVHTYSPAYAEVYHTLLDGMVERRMRAAIHLIGSFWYTAWIDAGQPDLSTPVAPEVLEAIEAERMAWKEWKKSIEPVHAGHTDE